MKSLLKKLTKHGPCERRMPMFKVQGDFPICTKNAGHDGGHTDDVRRVEWDEPTPGYFDYVRNF